MRSNPHFNSYGRVVFGITLIVLAAVSAHPLYAATFRGGQEYSLLQDSVVEDNLHLLGNNLAVNGTVEGDLVAAGGRIDVRGQIRDDALLAAGVVEIHGTVGGDVRAAAGRILVYGTIEGDLVALGGTIEVMPEAVVSGDMALYGDRIVMNGAAEQALLVKGSILEMNGTVGGTVQADIEEGLVVGDSATVGGDFIYTARNRALISDKAEENITGEIDFTQREADNPVTGMLSSYFGTFAVIKLVSVLAATLLFVLLFPRFSERVTRYTMFNTGRSLLIGALVWIMTPLIALALAITIVGLVPALGIILSYFTLLVLSKVLSGILAGAMLANILGKGYVVDWRFAALGVFALFLVGLVPVAGFLVALLVYWMIIGSIAVGAYEYWWKRRKAAPAGSSGSPMVPPTTSLGEAPDNLPMVVENGSERKE